MCVCLLVWVNFNFVSRLKIIKYHLLADENDL